MPTNLGVQSLAVDEPQRLGHIDDGDAGMRAERQQMLTIPGDEQIGLRGDGGRDDLIVIDIAGHDPRHGRGGDSSMTST